MVKQEEAFLELVRAGLWETIAQIQSYTDIDYSFLMRLAQDQRVVGLVAAGFEHVSDTVIPRTDALKFLGHTLQIEQRNIALNYFIGVIVDQMRKAGIEPLLVKGQGIAQCYERPLWRSSGDVDFFLDENGFMRAKELLMPLSSYSKSGGQYSKEFALTIHDWMIELHGSLRTGLSARVDKQVDAVQRDTFERKHIRIWKNAETDVLLPNPDNDVFFVFTHFIKHFYKGGMNLRQVCDWCRLLWTYKDSLNHSVLESRIRKTGLMMEWRVFSVMTIDWLGMPEAAMPLLVYDDNLKRKAEKALIYILRKGKWFKWRDPWRVATIFPVSLLVFSPSIFVNLNRLKIREKVYK
jgi:hypothetical protein